MKVCIIQPPYSVDYEKSDEYFNYELELLDKCDDSMDIIVMPESCDEPALADTKEKIDKHFDINCHIGPYTQVALLQYPVEFNISSSCTTCILSYTVL